MGCRFFLQMAAVSTPNIMGRHVTLSDTGLAVLKEHSSLCYIGRGNTLPNRSEYVMKFLK